MKRMFVVLSVLFFSILVFAEEGDAGDMYDEDDCGDTGCEDSGDTGDTGGDVTTDEERVECENEAGRCYIYRTITDGQYEEFYHYACAGIPQNKIGNVDLDGKVEVTEENCRSYLEKECGTKSPALNDYCTDEEINRCIKYESDTSHCTDHYMTEEEIRAEIDGQKDPYTNNATVSSVYYCCTNIHWIEESEDCLKEAKCGEDDFTDECCKCYLGDGAADMGDTSDAVDTTADSGDTTAEEDTADGDSATPATDSEAPAENKEESKSDGCSMLFV